MKLEQLKIKQEEQNIERMIACNLKLIRRIKGLTLAEVGKILGCSGQQVQKYETGQNKISVSVLSKFANLVEFPISCFFKEIDLKELIDQAD